MRCYDYPVTDAQRKTIPRELTTVFLDRDGVLNEKMPEGSYVTSWADFQILPGVPEAIARLNRAGLRVIVVSNQRGIALGLYTAADVDAIHAGFQRILSITVRTSTPFSFARTTAASAHAASRCPASSNRPRRNSQSSPPNQA